MCHMVADSLPELHEMAICLGVRRWFQDKPGAPHYNISKGRGSLAIKYDAIEVTSRDLLTAARRCRWCFNAPL